MSGVKVEVDAKDLLVIMSFAVEKVAEMSARRCSKALFSYPDDETMMPDHKAEYRAGLEESQNALHYFNIGEDLEAVGGMDQIDKDTIRGAIDRCAELTIRANRTV